MKYKKKLTLSRKGMDKINFYLSSTDQMGEDDTITNTIVFDDGIEMDIKVCGTQDDYPWTEAVLFYHGSEVCCSEPSDQYEGEWRLEYNGNEYLTIVEAE